MFHITMEEAYVDRGNAPLYSGQTVMPPSALGTSAGEPTPWPPWPGLPCCGRLQANRPWYLYLVYFPFLFLSYVHKLLGQRRSWSRALRQFKNATMSAAMVRYQVLLSRCFIRSPFA
jgi:hypothetical protein